MTSRNSLRKQIRAQRRALSSHQQEVYAQQFAGHFAKTHLFRNNDRIAFYMANDGELDPSYLMASAWAMGKKCYLPVLMHLHDKSLLFAPYEPDMQMNYNQFGIPEPAVAARHRIKASNLDLIIMPLVAFDKEGNRIGMGGGYYDRTLGFLNARTHWHKPRLVGIGYSFQEVPVIESESWDVALSYIATEKYLINIKTQ
ncbi:5-formyltetrahydrofolate cyclo-ligase [Kaarinaea lacus]